MVRGVTPGFRLRAAQEEVMSYAGGRMAISAVPGSGKTTTLSLLAAQLVADAPADAREAQVLIVTFSNAAVANFKSKIAGFLEKLRLPRKVGYDVRTLHSLSHLIVQSEPALANLDPEYYILDENEAGRIRSDLVHRWMERQAEQCEAWLALSGRKDENARRQLRQLLGAIAETVIRTAKTARGRPETLLERLRGLPDEPAVTLARMGAEVYRLYQEQLTARGAVDFNDLVWLAYELLRDHPDLLAGFRARWPFILEDEAQDSTPLQEALLELLTGPDGNWVRVGDPNQAINQTFTSADPRFFRRFCRRPDVRFVTLDQAGRSSTRIIGLANELVRYVCERYPEPDVRTRAFELQRIRPVDSDDAQPNPPAEESRLAFDREYATWRDEVADVCTRAARYAEKYPQHTLAILCPTNYLAEEVTRRLREMGVEFDDLLRMPANARYVAQALSLAMDFVAEPARQRALADLYAGLSEAHLLPTDDDVDAQECERLIASASIERLLFPAPGESRRAALPQRPVRPADMAAIEQFAALAERWTRAATLPADEFVLTVASDLLRSPFDLALAQQLATIMRRMADDNPTYRLPRLARELHELAYGARGLPGAGRSELGFEPQKGRITVATMHGAKGLEWDAVYLMGAEKRWFPQTVEDCYMGSLSVMEGDAPAEVAALVRSLLSAEPAGRRHNPTREAQLDLIAERLRLLYVGITRARRHLAMSWSADAPGEGGKYDRPAEMAPILTILRRIAEQPKQERHEALGR